MAATTIQPRQNGRSDDQINDNGSSSNETSQFKKPSRFSSRLSDTSLTTVEILTRENSELSFNHSEDEDDPLLFTKDVVDNDNQAEDQRVEPKYMTKAKRFSISSGNASPVSVKNALGDKAKFDAQAYLDKRVMTPLQERINAITILPNMIYCIYFVLAGCWLTSEGIEIARQSLGDGQDIQDSSEQDGGWTEMAKDLFGDEHGWMENTGCINIPMLPNIHALPPLPVVAGGLGVVVHAPFSFLYHWVYATKIHPSKRIEHWSRRLDNAAIHFAGACMSYATSGRMDYFILNAAFNMDCAYRQFERRIQPRRNLIRTVISILLYCLPVLRRGYYETFIQLITIFGLSGWLFAAYPFGGWSHSLFHVVVAFMPHLVMLSACELPSSQLQISLAAKCAVMAAKA